MGSFTQYSTWVDECYQNTQFFISFDSQSMSDNTDPDMDKPKFLFGDDYQKSVQEDAKKFADVAKSSAAKKTSTLSSKRSFTNQGKKMIIKRKIKSNNNQEAFLGQARQNKTRQ